MNTARIGIQNQEIIQSRGIQHSLGAENHGNTQGLGHDRGMAGLAADFRNNPAYVFEIKNGEIRWVDFIINKDGRFLEAQSLFVVTAEINQQPPAYILDIRSPLPEDKGPPCG